MIWNLDFGWLCAAFAVVVLFAFALGLMLDGVMAGDGFGALGNTFILTTGVFGGIYIANLNGLYAKDLRWAAVYGLSGAFVLLLSLAVGKAGLRRLL
ncbi:MAG: hypothetical protein WAT78_13350 [Rhizobiaceae bacterium]